MPSVLVYLEFKRNKCHWDSKNIQNTKCVYTAYNISVYMSVCICPRSAYVDTTVRRTRTSSTGPSYESYSLEAEYFTKTSSCKMKRTYRLKEVAEMRQTAHSIAGEAIVFTLISPWYFHDVLLKFSYSMDSTLPCLSDSA